MIENWKTKRFVWVLSLTLGPIVYGILLLTLPGRPNIETLKSNLIELVLTIAVYWALGLGLVWTAYWLGKFIRKHGPFAA
jgi:hypothetical protein